MAKVTVLIAMDMNAAEQTLAEARSLLRIANTAEGNWDAEIAWALRMISAMRTKLRLLKAEMRSAFAFGS